MTKRSPGREPVNELKIKKLIGEVKGVFKIRKIIINKGVNKNDVEIQCTICKGIEFKSVDSVIANKLNNHKACGTFVRAQVKGSVDKTLHAIAESKYNKRLAMILDKVKAKKPRPLKGGRSLSRSTYRNYSDPTTFGMWLRC